MNARTLREPWAGAAIAALSTTLLTAILASFRQDVGLLDVGLLFLLLTLMVASIWGGKLGFFAAVITNLSLNFFFIEPLHAFTVQEPKNIVALFIFFAVSLVAGSLLSATRRAAADAGRRQAETEIALSLSRAMSSRTRPDEALDALCSEVLQAFAAPGAAVLTSSKGHWTVLAYAGGEAAGRAPDTNERAAAGRAVSEGTLQSVGRSGLNQSRARVVFPSGRKTALASERSLALVPLSVGGHTLGVLRLDGPIGDTPFREHPEQLLNAIASEAALALQRSELAKAAAHADALQEADEMKTALMASISHDLKTPLAAIKAAITNIRDKTIRWSADDIEAFHQAIDSQTDRLNRVISDILDFNRIESGALTPEQVDIRALDLLETARDLTRLETMGREVTVAAMPSLRVRTDEALMTQAVVNLIENAVKYSTPGGAIRLAAVIAGSMVDLSVEDEGPGITPEDLPHVFERSFRASGPSRRVEGSGLGLTVVRGFVELCGGTVNAQSSPAGSRFVIRLPAAERMAAPA